jgi:hypothetical protein
MHFRDDRYRDTLTAKRLKPSNVFHRTGIAYSQLGRYTAQRGTPKFCVPNADTLAVIVCKLELDANYLLDADIRYETMLPIQAAAHMSLDWYLRGLSTDRDIHLSGVIRDLRTIASEHSDPPVWAEDWKRHHESLELRPAVTPETQPPTSTPRTRVPRRHRHQSSR